MKKIWLILLFLLFNITICLASEHFIVDKSLENRLEDSLEKVGKVLNYPINKIKIKIILDKERIPCYISYSEIIYLPGVDVDDKIIYHELAHAVLANRTFYNLNEVCQEVLAEYVVWKIEKENVKQLLNR